MTNSNDGFPRFPIREYEAFFGYKFTQKEKEYLFYLENIKSTKIMVMNKDIQFDKLNVFFSMVECINTSHTYITIVSESSLVGEINRICGVIKGIKEHTFSPYPFYSTCVNWDSDMIFDPRFYSTSEFVFTNKSKISLLSKSNLHRRLKGTLSDYLFIESSMPDKESAEIDGEAYIRNMIVRTDNMTFNKRNFIFE
jgi:hypothetical protein